MDPAFLAKIASPSLAIDDTAWLQSRIDPTAERQRILTEVNGTGPFRLNSWDGNGDIALTRSTDYWGDRATDGEPSIFVAEGDAGRRLDKLREGSVDAIDIVAPGDSRPSMRNPELTVAPRQGLNVAYVGFDNRFAPFDNEVVRQAIAIGIDRAAIVEAAFPPGTEVASHFLPCAIPYGCEGAAWPEPDPGGRPRPPGRRSASPRASPRRSATATSRATTCPTRARPRRPCRPSSASSSASRRR